MFDVGKTCREGGKKHFLNICIAMFGSTLALHDQPRPEEKVCSRITLLLYKCRTIDTGRLHSSSNKSLGVKPKQFIKKKEVIHLQSSEKYMLIYHLQLLLRV